MGALYIAEAMFIVQVGDCTGLGQGDRSRGRSGPVRNIAGRLAKRLLPCSVRGPACTLANCRIIGPGQFMFSVFGRRQKQGPAQDRALGHN